LAAEAKVAVVMTVLVAVAVAGSVVEKCW
jgi:hypothetical protein